AQSTGGVALGNTAYENVKGLRWSSDSSYPVVLDNVLYENDEAGLALENVEGAYLRRNRFERNAKAQLFVIRSAYDADDACFDGPSELVADFVFADHFPALDAYQHAKHVDVHARSGDCGAPPAKIDVPRLHVETTEYTERARALLAA